MVDQVDPLKKMVKELSSEKDPIQIVLVDWASHLKKGGNPLRERLDDAPALHSSTESGKDCIINAWFRPKAKEGEVLDYDVDNLPLEIEQWLDSLVLVDQNGKAIGAYPTGEGEFEGNYIDAEDLKEEESYERVKAYFSKALQKSRSEGASESISKEKTESPK